MVQTGVTRREFGLLLGGTLRGSRIPRTAIPDRAGKILDIADWSYYWYGVERVKLAAPSPSLSIAFPSHHAGLEFLVGAGESGLKNRVQ